MRMNKIAIRTIAIILALLAVLSGCQQRSDGDEEVSRYVEYQGRVCVRVIFFYREGDQRSSSIVLDGRAQGRNCISYQPIGNIGDTVIAVIRGIDTYTCE